MFGSTCGTVVAYGRRGLFSAMMATVVLAMVVMASGCGESRSKESNSWFWRFGDISGDLETIRHSPSPDQRRQAICRISKRNSSDSPDVLETIEHAALTDSSPAVRCVAVRALQHSQSDSATRVFLEILSGKPSPRPGGGDSEVRLAAAEGLTEMSAENRLPSNYSAPIAECGLRLLATDPSRNVRSEAARLLRHYPREDVLYGLADALDQRDFGVCYEAERSLMALTGHTHDYDSQCWREFLASTDDPFADQGAMDNVLNPTPPSWWSRKRNAVVQALSGFRSKADDQPEAVTE